MNEKSCLTNLIGFFSELTGLVDKGIAVDVVYLDFSRVLDTISRSILTEKLTKYGLDLSVLWVENWLIN